jgi:hypothetical protein
VIMTGLIYEEGESRMNSPHPSPEYWTSQQVTVWT